MNFIKSGPNFEIRKEIRKTKEFGRQKGLCFLLLELTPKKDFLFIIGYWNAKVGSQKPPGVTGKFGLGVQNEAGQRLIEFCQENTLLRLLQIKTSGIPGFQYCSEFFILLFNKRPSTSLQ